MNLFSTGSRCDPFPESEPADIFKSFNAPALPPPHPAEPDTFARHQGIPWHDQEALAKAKIVMVGGGGLNGLTGVGLVRSGARDLTIIDGDRVDRTNLPRQLFFADDLGHAKGVRLARNLAAHATDGGHITGIGLHLDQALIQFTFTPDILVVGVDNNACRFEAVRYARARRIPAVFTMLSRDAMRCQAFLQGAGQDDACLWCALPDLDPQSAAPCAAAIISSCLLASAFALFFVHRALMGWPEAIRFNWREADLLGVAPDRTGLIHRRPDCPVCTRSGDQEGR